MTAQADGTYVCDRCGGDCGNGGVHDALVISDMKTDDGLQVINLHFCRAQTDADGKRVAGCDSSILTPRNMEHFLEAQPKYTRPERALPPSPPQE